MKDENDKSTFDLADIIGEAVGSGELKVSKRYALVGHYSAVTAPKYFEVSGHRWNGSTTPDVARDSWQTPRWLFGYFDKMVGGFQIDAAADKDNALCEKYWTEEHNSLSFDWPEKVPIWCNPPYSDPLPWVEHVAEQANGNKCVIYMLLPDDISTLWFRRAWDAAAEAYPILHDGVSGRDGRSGRVSFTNAITGKKGKGNNKGSWVFVFRPHRSPLKIINTDRTICENEGGGIF